MNARRVHWLDKARRIESPNADDRPSGSRIDLIVIHGISLPPGQFGGSFVEALFTNKLDTKAHPSFASLAGVRVSAHLYISRRGGVTQFVAFDRRAWHAGVSAWSGRTHCNDFSIGVEIEGTDEIQYTNAQYVALSRVIRELTVRYPRLGRETIVGHNEIAPGRKSDPGRSFDWTRLYSGLVP